MLEFAGGARDRVHGQVEIGGQMRNSPSRVPMIGRRCGRRLGQLAAHPLLGGGGLTAWSMVIHANGPHGPHGLHVRRRARRAGVVLFEHAGDRFNDHDRRGKRATSTRPSEKGASDRRARRERISALMAEDRQEQRQGRRRRRPDWRSR